MKRLFIFIAAIFAAAVVSGQTPLPNDPSVRTGKLENGLTYYIRHNDKPAQRAEFYLASDVGAYQEEDHQDGLAHFLEHMCFNGTKNFPEKALLNYLQSIGAEFGRNINASTGFEQTQYMLNNIPIVRESIIDSCLLVLHDWSHFVTCDPAEIDDERGVILEERRTRRNAQWRMFEKSLPYYYGGTPYEKRTLIGSEEQLKTFVPESLTSFYHTWYRPDMQAVVVVGDVDVDKIEAKIKEIFSDIPAAENPKEKVLYALQQNAEPIIGIITDPEATSSSIEVLWKSEPMPKEMANTDLALMMDIIKTYVRLIMGERFNDITSKPDAPFLGASLSIGLLCNSAEAVIGDVTFKDGDAISAFTAFMTELEKMKRFGFTEGEVQRAKDKIISAYEKAAEAAPTRKNADFVMPILNSFHFNSPNLDPETRLQLTQMICGQLNANLLNQVAAGAITDENMVILYTGPEKEGLASPSEAEIAAVLAAVKNAEMEANEEEELNEPLISKPLKGSKITKEEKGIYGSTVWTLKNGVKVIVLPTQYKQDEIIFNLSLDGGSSLIPTEEMPSFEENIWSLYLRNTGISKFPATSLSKMLAGKMVSVGPYTNSIRHGISGSSTPKDLETAFQLMYLCFTDPRFDEDEYMTGIRQIEALLPNLVNNPQFKFQQAMTKTLYGENERLVELNEETLAKASLAGIERVYRNILFKDAAGAVLTIVGNVDTEALKPLVEKYAGSLPKGKKANEIKRENVASIVRGQVNNDVRLAMQTPKATVLQLYSAYMPVDVKTSVTLAAANYVLDMIYTKTIREQEGGTYGVGASMASQREPEARIVVQVYFDTNPESAEHLAGLAIKYFKELAENGPTEEELNMAKENLKKNIPESRIKNSYWSQAISYNRQYGVDYDAEYEAAVDAVTARDVKAVLQAVIAQDNFIQLTLAPEE